MSTHACTEMGQKVPGTRIGILLLRFENLLMAAAAVLAVFEVAFGVLP